MNEFPVIGKVLIFAGFIIAGIGIVLLFARHVPFFGKLPGDIYIQKENFSFYFPLTTCIIISAVISLILLFFGRR